MIALREIWNEARNAGHKQAAKDLKGARFSLWKNPGRLTERQKIKLAQIQQTNKPLYHAYLISQQLREIYRVRLRDRRQAARRVAGVGTAMSPPAVRQARQDNHQTASRDRSGDPPRTLSNARIEQVNTQLRLITRRAYGFHTPDALFALAMLTLGGLCPPLPA